MPETRIARKGQRISSAARKTGLFGAAAATATAMAFGMTAPDLLPTARAADVTLNGVTTGPVFRLLQAAGVNSVDFPNVAPPLIDTLTIDFAYTDANPVNLADQINAFPFAGWNILTNSFRRQPGGIVGSALLAGSGFATLDTNHAYQALLSSAGGNTLPGYTPLVGPGLINTLTGAQCASQGTFCRPGNNVTTLALLLLNSPLTPNGGLYTRFAPIANLFGINLVNPVGTSASSSTPATQGSGGIVTLHSAVVNVGLEYNALSDLPETLNPFSLANTLLATVLPTNLLGGVNLGGASLGDIETALGLLATLGSTSTTYSTLAPNDLPLLEPLRLPVRLINAVSNALGHPLNLGTPLADALQPALTILVNTGYTDVQTPTDGGTYNRTFDQSGDSVTFLSQATLTPAEWAQVPGDVVRALIVGFQDSFPLLRFGKTAPVLTVDGNHLKITYPSAPTGSTSTPTATSGVSIATPAATTPAAESVSTPSTGTTSTRTTRSSAGGAKSAAATGQTGSSSTSPSASTGSTHNGGVGGSKRSATRAAA
ncbi:PE-PPE domain-containing protein [Mycolicibacterium sphagni]|uniref:PE-PPE domain-containing protein n=1 Tax=Mycolicibacterium sphagni TaxID=1786 RepID=UPI0021F2B3B4|nr:PE-PPE domain-containing protein [Mycolicibacterium sphagni]MCV7177715.1 PE-PPE domain-containing protein [Mycolicibacterium sphagni]